MQRKCIVFSGKDQVEFIDEPIGEPGPGQILVETARTLISAGTEGIVLARKFSPGTHWDNWVKYPFRPGYSHVGRIIGVGEGITQFRAGERVFTRGGHASHVLVPAHEALHVPEGVSDEDATWAALGKIAQIGARAAEHRMGDSVVVIGLGQVGMLVVQYARLMGASEVIGIDLAPARMKLAKSHGATVALSMSAADALSAVKDLTSGRGAHVVYDVTGFAQVFPAALKLAADRGRVVLLGDSGTPEQQHLTSDVIRRGLRIVGAHDSHAPRETNTGVEWDATRVTELFLKYVQRGQIRVSDLVSHRFSPDRAAEAYSMLQRERDKAMGVVFEWK